jgi:O-antigen/teichoic acid export membrane protein
MTTTAADDTGRRDEIAKVARGGAANLAGSVVSVLSTFGLVLLLAHTLAPAQVGLFFTVTSLFLLVETVGRLGADVGLVYFVSRWRALGARERIRPGLKVALTPSVVLCAAAAVLAMVFAPSLANLLGDPQGHSVGLLRLLAAMLPVAVCYDIVMAGTRGFGRMRPTVLVERISRPAAQILLVAGVLAVGWSGAVGYAWALPYAGALCAGVYFLRKALHTGSASTARMPRAARVARDFWRFSLPRAAGAVAQIGLQRLDIVLVASMRGVREAAIYTAATRFLVVGQFVNQAIAAPLQPRLSAAVSVGAVAHARALYRISTTWLVLGSWPVFGLAVALAPLYMRIFGHQYAGGTAVVVLLSLAMLVASGTGLVDTVIIMAGRTTWNLATTLLALAVNVGVDLALIPPYGIVGAAVGWCLSILAANLVPLAVAWRRLHMHPFGRSTYIAYALCGVCFLAIPLLAYALSGWSEIAAAGGAVVGTAGFIVGLVRLRDVFGLTGALRLRARRGVVPTP